MSAPPKLHQKYFQFYPPLIRPPAKILPGTILSHKVSHIIFVPVKAPATREEELHALRMGKGWRVMQAFGCGLTCALMFHVEHQGTYTAL